MPTPASDPADELRRQITYNSANYGELGKFIRLEYILNILDNFTIVSMGNNPVEQNTRITQIRRILQHASTEDIRSALEQINRIVNP